jgi:hypothetical protein
MPEDIHETTHRQNPASRGPMSKVEELRSSKAKDAMANFSAKRAVYPAATAKVRPFRPEHATWRWRLQDRFGLAGTVPCFRRHQVGLYTAEGITRGILLKDEDVGRSRPFQWSHNHNTPSQTEKCGSLDAVNYY